jgi:membrane fusion protein (multidrug efflux system)
MENQTTTQQNVVYKETPASGAASKKGINKRFLIIFSILIIGGGLFGLTKWNHTQSHEETDDAQIEGSINPVIPRVSGYISKIYVSDNQRVKRGDTLLVLDDRDLRIKVE